MRSGIGHLALAVAVLLSGGAGTETQAQYNRRNAIVEAVAKTKNSIVTIKVEKRGQKKDTIGTGVIVDERGYVITNQHVTSGADRITVILADGAELNPSIVKEDRHHDIAILQVKTTKKLQALRLGPAGDLMVGETVIAVGHPFGYTNTVSTGIISALGREIVMPTGEVLTNLIQTCASINPGNSGGPLLNINGELVGINVALREGAQGIAFALNADSVQQVLSQHLSASKVAGVRHGLNVTEKVVGETDERQKVVVHAVEAEGPAANAGLKRGDQIVQVASRSVSNRFDVERALYDCRPGERVEVKVVRDGKSVVVPLALGKGQLAERVPETRPAPATRVNNTPIFSADR